MLFIFGEKSEFELIAQTHTECPLCRRRDGGLYWSAKKATVYFLPVATLKKTYVVGCPHCQEYWAIDQELAKRLHLQMQSQIQTGGSLMGGSMMSGGISGRDTGREIGSVSALTTARSESETRDAWFKAAHDGDTEGLKSMLKRGAVIDLRDGYGMTALHIAIEAGHRNTAALLMEKGADLNLRDSSFGKTPLLKAIEHDREEIAQDLLKRRVDVDLADKNGWTPLHRAAERGQMPVVQSLLAHSANVNARTNTGVTPLMQAFIRHHSEIVALLREMGATP